jgi:hypothetical protein
MSRAPSPRPVTTEGAVESREKRQVEGLTNTKQAVAHTAPLHEVCCKSATVGPLGITGAEAGVPLFHGHAGSRHPDLDLGAVGLASAQELVAGALSAREADGC